jgi:sulfur transfer complex TusBCD TusB component (DsrH family)
MITTIEEAKALVHYSTDRYDNIVVIEDGTVVCSNDSTALQDVVDNNNVFILKGDLQKTVKKTKAKQEDTIV